MAIQAGAEAVVKLKDALNDWDSKVGDADCGTTVSLHLILVNISSTTLLNIQ